MLPEECLHDRAAIDGRRFPQPITLAATFDPRLVIADVDDAALWAKTTAEVLVVQDPGSGPVTEAAARDTLPMISVDSMKARASAGFSERTVPPCHHEVDSLAPRPQQPTCRSSWRPC
jgi:hypothetical protein